MQSKTCTKCGNTFYRTDKVSDSTWRATHRCSLKCKYNAADQSKINFTFIKMKLSTHYQHNNPPSAVF